MVLVKKSGILTANSIDITGSLNVSSATTATNLANGVAGQISYQTAPGITGFLTTGISNLVLTLMVLDRHQLGRLLVCCQMQISRQQEL